MSNELGKYIRGLRADRGLTLQELMSKMGYRSHSYIQRIEEGSCKPSENFLRKLRLALKLTDEEYDNLFSLVPKSKDDYLSDRRKYLNQLLRETRSHVGSYAGEFDDEDIEMLIEAIEKWRERTNL